MCLIHSVHCGIQTHSLLVMRRLLDSSAKAAAYARTHLHKVLVTKIFEKCFFNRFFIWQNEGASNAQRWFCPAGLEAQAVLAGLAGLAVLAGLLRNDGTGSRPLQRQWLNSQRMQMNHRSSNRLALNEDLASESFDSHLGASCKRFLERRRVITFLNSDFIETWSHTRPDRCCRPQLGLRI